MSEPKPLELCHKLMSRLESQTTSVIQEYIEKDLQEAVLLQTTFQGFKTEGLLLHSVLLQAIHL